MSSTVGKIKLVDKRKNDIKQIFDDIKNGEKKDLTIDCFELSDELYDFFCGKDRDKWLDKFCETIKSIIELDITSNIVETIKKSNNIPKKFTEYFFEGLRLEKKNEITDEDINDEINNDEIEYNNAKQEIENIDEIVNNNKFKWRPAQLTANQKLIDNDFASGLMPMITGSGKSFIILKLMQNHINIKKPKNGSLYILTCQRMDIFRSLFFSQNSKGGYKLDESKIKIWKKHEIIDLTNINIIDGVNNNFKKIPLADDKINILVINNDYLRSLYKRKLINTSIVNLVIVDECHWITANKFFKMIYDFKYNSKINIIGFSATPIRDTQKSENNVVSIFSNTFDEDSVNKKVNIIFSYDLLEGMRDGIVLPYKISCVKINKIKGHKLGKMNKDILKDVIKDKLKVLPYKKIIVWTNTKDHMRQCYNHIKDNFNELTVYCTSSFDKEFSNDGFNTNYEEFYNSKGNSLLVCINKCKEGSDIPLIDCGIYFDGYKNRSILVCIQTSGRVIRPDQDGKKTHGCLIDTFILEEKENPHSMTIEKILSYLIRLLNLSDDKYEDEKNFYEKMRQLAKNMEYDESKKVIKIKIDDDHGKNDVIVELNTLEFDWSKFQKGLAGEIDKKFCISDDDKNKDEFEKLRIKIHAKKFKNKKKYLKYANKYNKVKEPHKKYAKYWINYYDFLGIETSEFPKEIKKWLQVCHTKKIKNNEEYIKKWEENDLPEMPEEFYAKFTNINAELGNNNDFSYRR
jgi:superfamily II DNA or RNA helicase